MSLLKSFGFRLFVIYYSSYIIKKPIDQGTLSTINYDLDDEPILKELTKVLVSNNNIVNVSNGFNLRTLDRNTDTIIRTYYIAHALYDLTLDICVKRVHGYTNQWKNYKLFMNKLTFVSRSIEDHTIVSYDIDYPEVFVVNDYRNIDISKWWKIIDMVILVEYKNRNDDDNIHKQQHNYHFSYKENFSVWMGSNMDEVSGYILIITLLVILFICCFAKHWKK